MDLSTLTRRSGTIKNEQFYTKDSVVRHVSSIVKSQPWFKSITDIIEPSAGAGAFLKQFPKAKAFDIDPKSEKIIRADFLNTELNSNPAKTLIVGNPPFGTQAGLAIKFLKHSAKFANYIAFILPASFMKGSMQNKLPPNFHLIYEERLPSNSFVSPDGNSMDVNSVFQIWVKDESKMRMKTAVDLSKLPLKFVKKEDSPNIAIRRVGGTAGSAKIDPKEIENSAHVSHYYAVVLEPFTPAQIASILKKADWSREYSASTGPRSISKPELAAELLRLLNFT